jgi:carbamate kinase
VEPEYLKRLLIALGGNAILQAGERGTIQEQIANVEATARKLARIVASWYEVVITHGNGPQVGNILIQNERAKDEVPAMPLDVCGAQSQGLIGNLIQQVLSNEIRQMGKSTEIATVLTQVVVDRNDPAFKHPTKPIGPWLTRDSMLEAKKNGNHWIEDPEKGWRRVVASPIPLRILNRGSIVALISQGIVVIACGGGGIPVVQDERGNLSGVEAVIDKDLASQRLALDIDADIFLILTDVPAVHMNFGTDKQTPIDRIHAAEMRDLLNKKIFPAGTIGPKVEAAVGFVEMGGEKAIIAGLDQAEDALKGKTGTTIVK